MKKLLLLSVLGISLISSQAQQLMTSTTLVAGTASNILATVAIIDNFIAVNATTNTATIKFYDSSTTSTNYIQQAYTSYASYATNYTVVFTNANNALVTNTFSGIFTGPTTVALATNTRPIVTILVAPAGTTLNKDVKLQSIRGLTAVSDQAVTLVTTYRRTY